MDVRLIDGSGIEATREIRARHPKTRVLMLTSFADDEALFASIMAGASGYVLKQVKSGELLRAIRTVGKGESLLDPAVTASVLDRLRKGKHLMKDEKLVEISPGPPLRINSKAVVPMTWKPAGAEALVPTIEADIEVAALGPSRTQLSMNARYRPPLGLLGRALDRALLHRVAEATVRDFVERVGETLRTTVATSGTSEHAAGEGVGTRGPEVRA